MRILRGFPALSDLQWIPQLSELRPQAHKHTKSSLANLKENTIATPLLKHLDEFLQMMNATTGNIGCIIG